MTAEKLVRGRWVITGAGDDDPLLEDGAVLIEADSIAERRLAMRLKLAARRVARDRHRRTAS